MTETEDYDKSTTPAAHASTHEDGGSDEITVEGLAGELTAEQKSAWAKVSGKPTTFTPEAHKTSHENDGADEISVAGLSGLLADPQAPAAHKTSHQDGGSDEISIEGLAGMPANATATPTASKIPIADAGGKLDSWITTPTNPKFQVHRNGVSQTITTATFTKIQFTTEVFDTNNNFDNTTNYRFTPTVAGYYSLHLGAMIEALNDGNAVYAAIFKNGTLIAAARNGCSTTGTDVGAFASVIANANGSTDYFEGFIWHNYGSDRSLIGTIGYAVMSGGKLPD